MIGLNKIYQGDSFKLIKKIDNNSIDLIVCDGPYGVTMNDWDKIKSIQEFNLELIKIFSKILKPGGSLYLFGKPDFIDFIDYREFLNLQSKIIWYQPSRLAQGRTKFTNNYDIIAHFTKDKPKTFNLDDVRVPQLVELTHRLRVEGVPSVKKGKYNKTKYNKKGKNPGDVWGDIKQLTYNSKELVSKDVLNTIQKPEKLIERIVKASSNKGDLVLDPFMGVGTTAVVCEKLNRNYIGFEINKEFIKLSNKRLNNINPHYSQNNS
jgi:site-specific DNA-methyltransferase (adenine-specific)/adenine-specific DNA-methyltransferase